MEINKDIERGARAFAGALSGVGIICLAHPLANLMLGNWPVQPLEEEWRYQFVEMLSQLLIVPLIGAVFLAGACIVMRRGAYLRIGAMVSAAAGALVLVLTVGFFRDSLALVDGIGADEASLIHLSTFRGIVSNLICAGGFLCVGWAAWRASTTMRARSGRSKRGDRNQPLIVMDSTESFHAGVPR